MIDCTKTENYFAERQRMNKQQKDGICKRKCIDCPLSIENNGTHIPCSYFETLYPKKAIEIVQKWSDEHPPKTYLSECLRLFPNILLDNDGTPIFCPYHLGFMSMDDCRNDGNCSKCWNQPIKNNEEGEKK